MDEIEEIKREKIKEFMQKKTGPKEQELEIVVNDSNFEKEVIERSKKIPVVVDFWATWCMPCVIIGPILEKLVKEYKGKFILAKLNVDEAPIISQRYNVMSIPTIKMFKNGQVVDEFVGAMPEPLVRNWLDKNLG